MERLTSEQVEMIPHYLPSAVKTNETIHQVFDELYRYKKIEEEIGCPIEVLVRALKDGIYQKDLRDSVKHRANLQWWKEENAFILQTYSCDEYTKDYKKTWWLKADRSE